MISPGHPCPVYQHVMHILFLLDKELTLRQKICSSRLSPMAFPHIVIAPFMMKWFPIDSIRTPSESHTVLLCYCS